MKEPSHWEPETIAGMTDEEIVRKLKELVPAFDLDSFVARTAQYISSEDLAEAEYYPAARFSDEDEDFIWLACEELWKRLVPDRPPVEFVAEQVDNLLEEIVKAGQRKRFKEVYRFSHEALDLVCRNATEETPSGRRLRRNYYERLVDTTVYDLEGFLDDMLQNLIGLEEYDRLTEIAGILGDGLDDDVFLDYKAEGLFALGKEEEAEKLLRELNKRNPDNPLFPLSAGDCHAIYGEKDLAKAKDYYLQALNIAKNHFNQPDGKDDLRAIYQRLILVCNEMGNYEGAKRYERLLDLLEAKKVGRNDPCPCGSGKKYKNCCGRDQSVMPRQSFDPRLTEPSLWALTRIYAEKNFTSAEEMNKYLSEINQDGRSPQWLPRTPLEQAQGMVYSALETTGKRRLELAKEALKVSADCADAYVLLAEGKADSPEEALKLYEEGVRAGERALGKKAFEEDAGQFWGLIETRPYMRAKAGLAQCVLELGRREEAIEHFRELLRLNPNDNQGIRYLLAMALLEMRRIDELEDLLGKYDEPTADWLFTKALVAFLKQGDSTEARKLLREALKHNPHVAPYLLGEKKLPPLVPEEVGFGDTSEAIAYAADFGNDWHTAHGAIEWLRTVSGKKRGGGRGPEKGTSIPKAFLQAFEEADKKSHSEE